MNSVTVASPAKLNLYLAVTGRRVDGFHNLVSLVAQVKWGDVLKVEWRKAKGGSSEAGDGFSLECSDPGVPMDGSNLVLRAARAFRAASGWREDVSFSLEKRIPMGAGLGGGSSNAVAALRALNHLAGGPLGDGALAGLAAQLGSDCALFLHEVPVAMRGRGEIIEALGPVARLRGRKVLIFKPGFGIATAEAYRALARGSNYLPAGEAEARLAGWLGDPNAPAAELLFNSFERVAFAKYLALPTLLDDLRRRFDLAPLMTGSGSACFAFPREGTGAFSDAVAAAIREAWGPSAFVVETEIA